MLAAPRFTQEDGDRAFEEWGANCGPGALAAMLHLTLDEVRPHLGDFERKGYVNPMLMYEVLDRLDVTWRKIGTAWPTYGLVRVQWEGPWTAPNVPMRARYRYTHWIGTAVKNGERGVFDINCMNNGSGWIALAEWERVIVPHLTGLYKRASGKWHVTNGIELELTAERSRAAPSGEPERRDHEQT